MRLVTRKIAQFLFLAALIALPRMVLASGLESLRAGLAALYSEEQSLKQISNVLREKAGELSERIAALKPETGEPTRSQRSQLEDFLQESKKIEAEIGRISTRLDSVRERISPAQENLLAELSRRIGALEKSSREKPSPQFLTDLLGLRQEKEELLDQIFTDLNPRIVLPAARPGDSPQEIQNKLEVLDLARNHLAKQLEMTSLRLEELSQQVALSRGLREFMEDTYDFSGEVSRRDEILAGAQAPPEASPAPNPSKDSPGGEGIAIIDFGDPGKDSSSSSDSTPEVRHLAASSSALALPAGPAPSLTLEEKIHRLKTRQAVIEELILRVNARLEELKRGL